MSFEDPEISLRVFLETASRVKAGGMKIEGLEMVGPNGLEPSTSSVSRKRSNQTELRAYKVLRVYHGDPRE
jgi:hypothetical protein